MGARRVTYLQYHLVFIAPLLALLALLTWRAARRAPVVGAYQPDARWVWRWYALFPLIPIAYTTPWDNYLVARGVWTYPPERVLARIGYVPVEEYAFFVLQTLITGLWLMVWLRRAGPLTPPAPGWTRWAGGAAWLLLAFVGVLCLRAEPTFYLGLILAWACPVMAGLWAFGGDLIAARARAFWWAVVPPTVYLWLTDWIAIHQGIWSISARFTSGLNLLGLPAEEMLFFLITNLLVVTGLMLFWHPLALGRVQRGLRVVRPWMACVGLYALLKIPVPLWPAGFPLLATFSTVFLALGALLWAWERVGARAALLAALALAVGLGVEVLGSRTGFPFGPYQYSPPGATVLGVPLLVPLGWFAMTLAAGVLARGRAWLAGLLLVAWDVGLEPLMTAQGFWTWGRALPALNGVTVEAWARPTAPAPLAVWAGAPIQNFIAWFLVGAGLVWAFGRLAPALFGLKGAPATARVAAPILVTAGGPGGGGPVAPARPRPAPVRPTLGPVGVDLRLAYLIECFFLPAGLLLLGQPLAALVTLIAMGGAAWISLHSPSAP